MHRNLHRNWRIIQSQSSSFMRKNRKNLTKRVEIRSVFINFMFIDFTFLLGIALHIHFIKSCCAGFKSRWYIRVITSCYIGLKAYVTYSTVTWLSLCMPKPSDSLRVTYLLNYKQFFFSKIIKNKASSTLCWPPNNQNFSIMKKKTFFSK